MAIQDGDLFVVGKGDTVRSATGKDVKNYIDTEFINSGGDTMTGELNVQYPTADDHASSKEYVDEEISKIRSELSDIATDLSNGSYEVKNPGGFQIPSDGQFLLYNASNFSTLTFADVVLIAIANTNREGSYESFSDAVGGYIRFRFAGSDNEVVYAVNSIPFSNTQYTQLEVVLHSATRPSVIVNSVAYVNTLRIQGIDLNDLEQELDQRYVKLVGDSDVSGTVQVGTAPGSMNITLDKTGDVTAKFYYGDGSKLENLPKGGAFVADSEPPIVDYEEGDLWFQPVKNKLHVVAEINGVNEWVDTCCGEFMPLDISILPDLDTNISPVYYKEYMPTDLELLPSLP